MKTLVIHPIDHTTDFLSKIYYNKGWKVIRSGVSNSELKRQIQAHDRIIMLGHGYEGGLYDLDAKRIVISPSHVQLLREKICIGIWCNANVFFEKYELNGHYTGMIISEVDEAYLFSVYSDHLDKDIEESNTLFSKACAEHIDEPDFARLVTEQYEKHGLRKSNPVISFNSHNIFTRDTRD